MDKSVDRCPRFLFYRRLFPFDLKGIEVTRHRNIWVDGLRFFQNIPARDNDAEIWVRINFFTPASTANSAA